MKVQTTGYKQALQQIRKAQSTGAETLNLFNLGLATLPPELFELNSLVALDISRNQLTTLPPEISRLTKLRSLQAWGNEMEELPPQLFILTKLTELNVSFNPLTKLPYAIGNLTNLQRLTIRACPLTGLPPDMEQLVNLEDLSISANQFAMLLTTSLPARLMCLAVFGSGELALFPAGMAQFKSLTSLGLYDIGLVALPPDLFTLTELNYLNLSNNQLSKLPPEIARLVHLTELHLSHNTLTTLPSELARLSTLIHLAVNDNPLTSPPPEIVAQGIEAILAYLRAQLKAGRPQWVSKMLVVGEGGVGKTSLLRGLRGEPFLPQDTTRGIAISALELPHPTDPTVTMTLNTWDFGGQEIQHATHQFFLTNRSLFLLAWNARLGYEQSKLEYWLETIKARAGSDVPILLVATHTEQWPADLPLTDLKRKFPQIVGQCAISNTTGQGMDELRETVRAHAADPKQMPLMGEKWPFDWLAAANAVRALPEKHVTKHAFEKHLATHRVTDKDAEVLTRWLHELGDILHFRDNVELNDTVVLKPQWVTQYIARVLASDEVKRRVGIFTRDEMERVWGDVDPTMQERFLRLMEQFDLSYRTVEDQQEISLVVERLPRDEADYHAAWDKIKNADPCHEISMRFQLSTVPAGVPTWYIARQHRFTTHTHWRTGVLFRDRAGQHLGLTRAYPYDKYLQLIVCGPNPQDFFALLKDGIEVTLSRFPGLGITRLVPCACNNGGVPCKQEFDYDNLKKLIHKSPTVQCPISGLNVPIAQILYDVPWTENDVLMQAMEDMKTTVRTDTEEVKAKIEAQTAFEQREFLKLFEREQSLIESECPNVFVLRHKEARTFLERATAAFSGQKIELQLLCQYPGDWHPTEKGGIYDIDNPAEWLRTIGPYVRGLVKLLKLAAPLANPALGLYFSDDEMKAFEKNLKATESLIKDLPDIDLKTLDYDDAKALGMGSEQRRIEGAGLRALRHLLQSKDPVQNYGGLKKVLTPEGHYLWLCPHHAKEFDRAVVQR